MSSYFEFQNFIRSGSPEFSPRFRTASLGPWLFPKNEDMFMFTWIWKKIENSSRWMTKFEIWFLISIIPSIKKTFHVRIFLKSKKFQFSGFWKLFRDFEFFEIFRISERQEFQTFFESNFWPPITKNLAIGRRHIKYQRTRSRVPLLFLWNTCWW